MYIISSIHILIINSIVSYSFSLQIIFQLVNVNCEGLTELLKSEGAGLLVLGAC